MRIGLFGGTFDPIHLGHLILAERCREEAGLEEVWFLPSYVPPHKTERTITRFEQRCEMVALATTGQDACHVRLVAVPGHERGRIRIEARGAGGALLAMDKEQPMAGVSGTEMFASQFHSIRKATGLFEPFDFV